MRQDGLLLTALAAVVSVFIIAGGASEQDVQACMDTTNYDRERCEYEVGR